MIPRPLIRQLLDGRKVFIYFLIFFIKVLLLYNVVLISAV